MAFTNAFVMLDLRDIMVWTDGIQNAFRNSCSRLVGFAPISALPHGLAVAACCRRRLQRVLSLLASDQLRTSLRTKRIPAGRCDVRRSRPSPPNCVQRPTFQRGPAERATRHDAAPRDTRAEPGT